MAYKIATASLDNPIANAGLRLAGNKQSSTHLALRAASVPDILVLPLDQHAGAAAIPIVKPGDMIKARQPIARPGATISAWLHSPVSGAVTAIETRATVAGESLSIVVANDHHDSSDNSQMGVPDFTALTPGALCEYIARGGIVGLGGAAFPTAVKLTRHDPQQPLELILNGVECEPYISCDDMLMRERAQDIVSGAQVMLHALSARRCIIAIENDKPRAEEAMRAALVTAADTRLSLAILASEYPAGGERQLITALTRREVPSGGVPQDIGLICQNVGTAAAVARWVRNGEPLISRIVTVTGDGVAHPANLEVRIGTGIGHLVADCGGYTPAAERLLVGGSMMGVAVSHDALPIVKGSNCVVIASTAQLQPRTAEMPCIRCGDCAQACPAALLPQDLHFHALSHDLSALAALGLLDCIECGCCDYVCPSQIPLTQRLRAAKPALIEHLDREFRARHYRQRYETRNARIAELEAKRRAKLEARRRR